MEFQHSYLNDECIVISYMKLFVFTLLLSMLFACHTFSVSAKIWLCSSVGLNVSINIYILIILTVSEDENAEHFALANGVHVVISSSGLKHITDNHPNFEKTWDLPVVVKEYPRCGKIF